jgi:hypothetical protein
MLRGNGVEEGKIKQLSATAFWIDVCIRLTLLWVIMAGSSVALLKSRCHGLAGWQAGEMGSRAGNGYHRLQKLAWSECRARRISRQLVFFRKTFSYQPPPPSSSSIPAMSENFKPVTCPLLAACVAILQCDLDLRPSEHRALSQSH